jgi:hypothetical protein
MDAEPVAANDAVAVNVEPAKPKQCACDAEPVATNDAIAVNVEPAKTLQ